MKHIHPKKMRAKKKLHDQLGEWWFKSDTNTIRDEIDSEIIEQLRNMYVAHTKDR